MDYFPVRIVLEISEVQAVLLDKTHVTMMAFPKFKKNELTNIKSMVCIVLLH
jgi:hypothetical protein